MLKIIEGDLLEADEKYIVHQANCVTTGAGGLAKYLFEKYPFSDIYSKRKKPDKPGHIIIKGDGKKERFIINLMGQFYPGRSKYNEGDDGPKARQKYFFQGLLKIAEIENLESVAFPFMIGCGLACGDWDWYLKILNKFADSLDPKGIDVIIYRLPE